MCYEVIQQVVLPHLCGIRLRVGGILGVDVMHPVEEFLKLQRWSMIGLQWGWYFGHVFKE